MTSAPFTQGNAEWAAYVILTSTWPPKDYEKIRVQFIDPLYTLTSLYFAKKYPEEILDAATEILFRELYYREPYDENQELSPEQIKNMIIKFAKTLSNMPDKDIDKMFEEYDYGEFNTFISVLSEIRDEQLRRKFLKAVMDVLAEALSNIPAEDLAEIYEYLDEDESVYLSDIDPNIFGKYVNKLERRLERLFEEAYIKHNDEKAYIPCYDIDNGSIVCTTSIINLVKLLVDKIYPEIDCEWDYFYCLTGSLDYAVSSTDGYFEKAVSEINNINNVTSVHGIYVYPMVVPTKIPKRLLIGEGIYGEGWGTFPIDTTGITAIIILPEEYRDILPQLLDEVKVVDVKGLPAVIVPVVVPTEASEKIDALYDSMYNPDEFSVVRIYAIEDVISVDKIIDELRNQILSIIKKLLEARKMPA